MNYYCRCNRIEIAWKDLPKTEAIDRNKFDIEDTLSSHNFNFDTLDAIEELCSTFKEISSLRNEFISASNIKKLFGNLIKQYDFLEKEQKWKVFIIWATKYYVDSELLKKIMMQNFSDFESLVRTVNDLRKITEPKYLWIFEKLAKLKGGQEMIADIKIETLNMVLECTELSSFQRSAVQEMNNYVNAIKIEACNPRYATTI